jgi:hypothetical protein
MTKRRLLWAIAFALASVAASLAMWGFTVDDALISIRYAHHLVSGAGYRFNLDGPATDGVTPLPWPLLLAPLANAPLFVVLLRVKVLGVVLVAASSALASLRETTLLGRATALLLLTTCLPLAAYAPSGMETPLAVLLCTGSVASATSGSWWLQAVLAGLAAAVRPELLPWAATVSCGFALASQASPRRVFGAVVVAAAPFVTCAGIRRAVFGRFAPLAVSAKPSDLTHGLVYVAAALLACGVPLLLLARPRSPFVRVVVVAFAVHVLAVAAAGGDSMPYARLLVPVVPSIVMAHMGISLGAKPWAVSARTVAALGLSAYVIVVAAPRGRAVMREREDLVARGRPLLADAKRIATVDIGWVSAATNDAHIVDLAGLTDPDIAALPGGHTSKRVSGTMLLDRDVDTLVLYDAHGITQRLARDPVVRSHYDKVADLDPGYVVLQRVAPP